MWTNQGHEETISVTIEVSTCPHQYQAANNTDICRVVYVHCRYRQGEHFASHNTSIIPTCVLEVVATYTQTTRQLSASAIPRSLHTTSQL